MFYGYPFASFEEWGTLCAAAAKWVLNKKS